MKTEDIQSRISEIDRTIAQLSAERAELTLALEPPQPPAPDPELDRICRPHAETVNEYLRACGRIKPRETWEAMPPDFRIRVLRNPAGFLKVALNRKTTTH